MQPVRFNRPPCIVLGLETQIGLSLVRELGRAGIPVIGIAQNPRAIGLRSRYLTRGVVVPDTRSEALLASIRDLGQTHGSCCLLTVSETNLTWLNQHRGELGQVRLGIPDAERLALVLDKRLTLAAARGVGIAVPETAEPEDIEQARQLATSFPFPAVLKWKNPQQVSQRLHALGLPLHKAEYVYTSSQWLAVAERYACVEAWPMVQTYCPGRGLGQFFFMHNGIAVRRFQHLRIAEWPPEGGFSSVCDAVPLDRHVELQERSIALLRDIGWQGVAMVEYRWDAASDQAVLMEINGRFWGSHPLAVHCGAGFALLAYHQTMGLSLPHLPAARDDLRCRMVATELKRLRRIVFQQSLIADRSFIAKPGAELWRFLSDYLRTKVRYYVWSLEDPLPFLADLRNALQRAA